jgi:hypothetical protein
MTTGVRDLKKKEHMRSALLLSPEFFLFDVFGRFFNQRGPFVFVNISFPMNNT